MTDMPGLASTITSFPESNSSTASPLDRSGSTAGMKTEKAEAAKAENLEVPQDTCSINGAQSRRLSSESIPLTILHTNDIHGHVEPFVADNKIVGGIAYLAEEVKKERAIDPAHTLLLDGGDITRGSPLSDFFDGKPVIDAMNEMYYDVMVLGNHDFDAGLDVLARNIEIRNSPVLAANLVVKKKDSPIQGKTEPYTIKELDGVKIGVIGVVTPDSMKMLSCRADMEAIDIVDPIPGIERCLREMKEEKKADVIILLSHLGVDEDVKIADRFKEIDVIVGGHSHTELGEPIKRGDTIILQAGSFGKKLGKAELTIDRSTNKVHLKDSRLIPISAENAVADGVVESIVRKYTDTLGPIMSETIAELPCDLTQKDYHHHRAESNLGDAITDIFREQAHSDIGFIGASALRCNLFKGKLTVRDIFSLIPWTQQLTSVKLKGKYIPQMLEEGLGMVGITFSGLRAVIDTNRPRGSQVISVTRDDGAPLDPERSYTIATQNYIADGFLGFNSMNHATGRKDHGELRGKVIDWIKSSGKPIRTEMDGRLINRAES